MTITNEEFIKKFDAHEEFDHIDITDMCIGEIGNYISRDIVGTTRFFCDWITVFEVNDRFFKIKWREDIIDGLVNEEYSDKRPQEVRKIVKEVRKIEKIIYDYVPLENECNNECNKKDD